jgi:hypothetical protein
MPLPAPAPRDLIHTRTIECKGYRRTDGLWDIEGHLVDVKDIDLDGDGAREMIPARTLIHNMWIRLTIDMAMNVLDVVAVTDDGPYPGCPAITGNFRKLIGITIGPGWQKAVRSRVGGTEGCTHLINLLGPVANTAFQTTVAARMVREKAIRERFLRDGVIEAAVDPYQLGSCHVYADGSPESRARWPQLYKDR